MTRIRFSFSNYTPSTFSEFNYAIDGDTIIIMKIIEILENKGYTKVKTKSLKPKQYYIGHDGYELIFKDARHDWIFYIRQGENNKVAIISHTPSCYWWEEWYIYRKGLTCAGTRSYQIPTKGYIEQNESNVSIIIRKFNKLIHKTSFKY